MERTEGLHPPLQPSIESAARTEEAETAHQAVQSKFQSAQNVWKDLVKMNQHPRESSAAQGAEQEGIAEIDTLFEELAKNREATKEKWYSWAKSPKLALCTIGIGNFIAWCTARWKLLGILSDAREVMQTKSVLKSMVQSGDIRDLQLQRQLQFYGRDQLAELKKQFEAAKLSDEKRQEIAGYLEKAEKGFNEGNIAKGAMYLKRAKTNMEGVELESRSGHVTTEKQQISRARLLVKREQIVLQDEFNYLWSSKAFSVYPDEVGKIQRVLNDVHRDTLAVRDMSKKGGSIDEANKRLENARAKLELVRGAIEHLKELHTKLENSKEGVLDKYGTMIRDVESWCRDFMATPVYKAANESTRLHCLKKDHDETLKELQRQQRNAPHWERQRFDKPIKQLNDLTESLAQIEALLPEKHAEAAKLITAKLGVLNPIMEEFLPQTSGGGSGDNIALGAAFGGFFSL